MGANPICLPIIMEKISLEKNGNENPVEIEIPKEELKIVSDIFEFLNKISEEGYSDGSIYAESNSKFTIQELIRNKTYKLSSTLDSLPESEKYEFEAKIMREAEYEAKKGNIDFLNYQFEKLTKFIESKPIWKYKFSTNYPFILSQFYELRFKGDGSESQQADALYSYAGQGRDSIYYVSNSGLSLRLKKSLLFKGRGIKDVLQKPQELILFFNQIEKERRDLNVRTTFNDIEDLNSIDFPAELVSFEPKIEYNVEEFTDFDFSQDKNSNYKSKIEVVKDKDRIIVKNYDNTHPGHQINRIYYKK